MSDPIYHIDGRPVSFREWLACLEQIGKDDAQPHDAHDVLSREIVVPCQLEAA